MRRQAYIGAALLALSAAFLMSGCGFQPMYGSHSAAVSDKALALKDVSIDNIPDEEGVYLRNALMDRFYTDGYPANPKYRLSVFGKIHEAETDLDITSSSESTRGQLTLTLNFKLTDLSTGSPVIERKLTSISSYNILESEFATRVSEQQARESALEDLARQIELNVTLHFNQRG